MLIFIQKKQSRGGVDTNYIFYLCFSYFFILRMDKVKAKVRSNYRFNLLDSARNNSLRQTQIENGYGHHKCDKE